MVTANEQIAVDKFNGVMNEMNRAKQELLNDSDTDSDDDGEDSNVKKNRKGILQQAIDLALEQGRGWKPGEKEEYIAKLLDDDYTPPIFANTVEEVQKSGLQEAFTSLIYDEDANPTQLMIQFNKRGKDAYANGQRNVMKNMQYYRDAINFWYEAFAWAIKIKPICDGDYAYVDTDDETYTPIQLNQLIGTICSNIALAHIQLKNWGHTRNECIKGLSYDNKTNIKLYYRLIKSYEMLHEYELAGDYIDKVLIDGIVPDERNNKDIIKIHKELNEKIRKARLVRQQRERQRAERISKVKAVWKHCINPIHPDNINSDNNNNNNSNTTTSSKRTKRILLGRVPLVTNVSDDEEYINDPDENANNNSENETLESRWHHHLPHSGALPSYDDNNNGWSWPCMFVYPSHNQSDFITNFYEYEMIAYRMADVFPEIEENSNNNNETKIVWDYNNEFICSQLAVYMEVHTEAIQQSESLLLLSNTDDTQLKKNKKKKKVVVHPDSVELLVDQGSCMRFYESSRALKGDEGNEMMNVVRIIEQQHLFTLRKQYKKVYQSLWNKPIQSSILRIHPAMTLYDILTDPRIVVPNFLVTFIMFPENHPMHAKYLEEHKCIGILEPPPNQSS